MSYVWTNERPTVMGWYWWRFSPTSKPNMFWVDASLSVHGVDGEEADHVDECDGQWAGPIEEPKEA